jgi:ligand-binding sensor domain-containing protein
MKELLIIVITVCYSLTNLLSQAYTTWKNYSFSQRVTGIDFMNNDIWISTQGGLVKYDKKTGYKTYYNRANANLPDNFLGDVFCTTNGDVWVGGRYYGIGKFNGQQCTIYNQSNSGLPFDQLNTKVKIDKNGNVWIASFRWIARFNGSSWKTWITGSDISAWPLVSGFDIDKNGVVWIYSTDGIGKIENEKYSIVSTIGSGLIAKSGDIKVDFEQNVWIAIDNEGLYKYDGSIFTLYSSSNTSLPTNSIYAISFDSENNMWLATANGLVKFSISSCQLYKPAPPDTVLLCLKVDNNDTIWCGSLNGNLLCFDGTNFTSIDLSNSPLKSNYISDILVDSSNNTWVATTKNVVKKTNNDFYSVFNKQGNALAQDNEGAIWVAFDSGDTCLLKIDSKGNTVFDSLNSPFNKKRIKRIRVDNNNHLWATTNYGLFEYNGVSFINYNTGNSGIPSNEIFEITFDKDNILWGGSSKGLFKFNGANWTVWNTENSAIPTNIVNGLYIAPNNKIWLSCMDEDRIIGTEYGGGLTSFDGQTMITYNISNSGLLCNTIFGIYVDKNNTIWLATYTAGLMSFDTNKDKWATYNVTNSGIANNFVQGITQDESGNLWMGHNDAGISVFNPDSFQLSINKIDNCNASFMIFPNPVRDELYVKVNTNVEKNIVAQIYDLNGRLICSFSNQKINQNNPTIHFKLQNVLHSNQMYILRLLCDSEQLSKKFLFDNK